MSKGRLLCACLLASSTLCLGAARAEESEDEKQDGLATLRERGELWWGSDAQGGAPFVFPDPVDPDHLIGFEVEISAAVAKRLGVRANRIQGPWDKLLELLARGDFDIALNGIEVAEEKKRVCLLTRPYYVAAQKLTVRKNDPNAPRTFEQLRGRRIGTLPASLAERILQRAGAEPVVYDGGQDEIYQDLLLGRTDGVLLDDSITRYYGEVERELEVVDGSFGEIRYAIATRLADTALRDQLDLALEALAKDGTLRRIYERWGLWTPLTANFLGDPRPSKEAVAEEFERWRASVGKLPPFWERVTTRYPVTLPLFARGAAFTVLLSLASMALAVGLGVALGLARKYGSKPVSWLSVCYIEFFRGTPLLIQLTMIYFGLPELGVKLDPWVAGWLALGLNYASAEAENYRAGLESIPAGQLEAARVLGLSGFQTLRHVVVPQAIRISIPPMTNDFIALLKDSSLVSLVTLTELTKTYTNLASSMRDHLGLGVVVAIWYLVIGLPFAQLARVAERKLGRHLRRATL